MRRKGRQATSSGRGSVDTVPFCPLGTLFLLQTPGCILGIRVLACTAEGPTLCWAGSPESGGLGSRRPRLRPPGQARATSLGQSQLSSLQLRAIGLRPSEPPGHWPQGGQVKEAVGPPSSQEHQGQGESGLASLSRARAARGAGPQQEAMLVSGSRSLGGQALPFHRPWGPGPEPRVQAGWRQADGASQRPEARSKGASSG